MKNQKEIWNKIAPLWSKYREKAPKEVINFLKDKSGRILDLGCGSGRNCIKLNGNFHYFCLDFSREMLKLAEVKLKKNNINTDFILSDSKKIPFKENYFDSVICYSVLHCIKNKKERQETLNEIYRTLKKNGNAFISVWSQNSPRLKNKGKECFISWSNKNEKLERYTYVYNKNELVKELKDIGFRIVKVWEEKNINVIVSKD